MITILEGGCYKVDLWHRAVVKRSMRMMVRWVKAWKSGGTMHWKILKEGSPKGQLPWLKLWYWDTRMISVWRPVAISPAQGWHTLWRCQGCMRSEEHTSELQSRC